MSTFSAESAVQTATPAMPPVPYFGGAVSLVPGNAKVTVNFAAAPINTTNGTETGLYRVSYKKTSDSTWQTATVAAVSPANASINAATLDVTGLVNGTPYQFTAAVQLTPQSSG